MMGTAEEVCASSCTVDYVQAGLRVLEGRWKLVIVSHLFRNSLLRFSELERLIPGITQKMLIQQLRALEADGVVERIAHPVVPPHVEYRLTPDGLGLEGALIALDDWARTRHQPA
ncbi:winged helix-turn-helix transcriptional regulator [Streptomyces capitiformicae]|jgi:DNA-binding HxlR family transcriptional regulator|uniref:Transcriptional regulator n=1 Tax=Streptomyces capitiformicae TaxID=2014920 RepID=A0A919DQF6_9ACTN|nr:winged helix-turn-helix transcriptional regulator [Streptomyces capitiformicae]GHE66371.1 transcriptional regulator [Streptomyces capitiformicae]